MNMNMNDNNLEQNRNNKIKRINIIFFIPSYIIYLYFIIYLELKLYTYIYN